MHRLYVLYLFSSSDCHLIVVSCSEFSHRRVSTFECILYVSHRIWFLMWPVCGQRMKQPFPDYFCISHPTACSSGWKTAWPERIGKPHTMDMTLLASGRPANIKLGSLELHSLSFMHVKGVSGFPVFHFLFQNGSHTKCNCRLNDPSCQQVSKERQSMLLAIQHKDYSLPSWKNTLAT